ncbi:MAG: hypothetical protein AAGJ82_15295 [Bacteroidota bacterium]
MLSLGSGQAWKYVKVHVYHLPSARHQYLAVERVYIEDRGKGKAESELIVPYLQIDQATADELLDLFCKPSNGYEWRDFILHFVKKPRCLGSAEIAYVFCLIQNKIRCPLAHSGPAEQVY